MNRSPLRIGAARRLARSRIGIEEKTDLALPRTRPAMYIGVRMLEKRLKTATPCHFLTYSRRFSGGRPTYTNHYRTNRSDVSCTHQWASKDPVS
jgi:hypothetical protein